MFDLRRTIVSTDANKSNISSGDSATDIRWRRSPRWRHQWRHQTGHRPAAAITTLWQFRSTIKSLVKYRSAYICLCFIDSTLCRWICASVRSRFAYCRPFCVYSVSQKNPPRGPDIFSFFHKRLIICNRFFTHLLNVPIFARLQIFIQLSLILTKLCHIKRDYPPSTRNMRKMSKTHQNARVQTSA